MPDGEEPIKRVSGRPGGGAYPNGESDFLSALSRGVGTPTDEDKVVTEMRKNRSVNRRRTAAANPSTYGRGGQADLTFATGRPADPMFYWKQNNLPYDVTKEGELVKIREYCRLLYMTHPIIASAIDIFSKYPLTGMELVCKDKALTEFYTSLFFEQLNYEDFLIDVGREYWTVGEAWPLGSFNETLGVWEDDELINPDDVNVIRSPFLKDPRFEMRLPETLRKIIQERSPKWEFEALMRSYPELKNFLADNARMPVSNILLKQLRFKADTFHPRGIPILMRGFRAIYQEEMLNAAQDAIASRLYTPLILARLGASATDLGTTQPWIPTRDDLEDFEDSLDAALAADFRVLVHHFAVQMDSVFGRENMPQMDSDFERLTDRQLQVFGLSRTMLSGASAGETYAADALNRDLISQLLTTYQRMLKKFVRDRMLIVAEAQEHYDYEERNGKRYVVMEEILERDEETGEERIVEQPKLLVPDLNLKAMNMKSESDLRQFLEAIRAEGVPISMKTRLVNVPVDLEEEIETTAQEQVDGAVKAQEVRKRTYLALKAQRLPIPEDLKQDFEPHADDGGGDQAGAQEAVIPTIGTMDPASTMGLAPTPQDFAASPPQTGQPDPSAPAIQTLPRNQIMQPGRTRPPESDEQRAGMPTAAARAREAMEEDDIEEGRGHLLTGPSHVGMRRWANVSKDVPLDDVEATG